MPPVITTDPAAAELVQAYADAWADIEQRQRDLIDNPLAATKRARLREMQDEITRQMAVLNEETDDYVSRHFPEQYAAAHAAGYQAAAEGVADYTFRQADRQAAEVVARGLQRDLTAANLRVVESTRTLVRKVGTDATLRSLLQGDTAKQASREMRRILANDGIHAVTYANGRQMGLKGYAEMVVRSQTAIAYNGAVIHGAESAGVAVFEVFDGPSCGWEYHDSPTIANGRVVSASEAAQYPISHPNCRRALGPRPDLSLVDAVKDGGRGKASTTAGQEEAQLQQDDARGLPTRRELAQRRAEAAAGKKGSYRLVPKADPARVKAAIQRPNRVLERTAAAEARLAKAAKKAGKPTPAAAASARAADRILDPKLAKALGVPEQRFSGFGTESGRKARARFDATGLDTKTSPMADLLRAARDESDRLGFKDNLLPAIRLIDRGTGFEERVIRYLEGGGHLPAPRPAGPVNIRRGRVDRDATSFPKLTRAEFEKHLDDAGQLDVFTADEAEAVRKYSTSLYQGVNSRLRKGGKGGPFSDQVRSSMQPLPTSLTVERGVGFDAFGVKNLDELKKLQGTLVEERGFMSTGVGDNSAFSGDVQMLVEVPRGTRGVWARPLAVRDAENELILDPGTRFRILEVKEGTGKLAGRNAVIRVRIEEQADELAAPVKIRVEPGSELRDRYNGGKGVVSRKPLTGGQMAEQVELLTFEDGTRAVMKRSAFGQEAATELAYSRIGRQLGAKVPEVHRLDERTVLMDYVEDTRDLDAYGLRETVSVETDAARAVYGSESGQRLGLLDTVLQHQDRHQFNWLLTSRGDVVGIDNGMRFIEPGNVSTSPFAENLGLYRTSRNFVRIEEWLDNDYTPADWERVRAAVRSVESELRELPVGPMARYGADPPADGFEAVMRRVDAMAARARGTRDRLAT